MAHQVQRDGLAGRIVVVERDFERAFVDARLDLGPLDGVCARCSWGVDGCRLLDAGFEIVDWQDSAYAGAVVVVEAKKPD